MCVCKYIWYIFCYIAFGNNNIPMYFKFNSIKTTATITDVQKLSVIHTHAGEVI